MHNTEWTRERTNNLESAIAKCDNNTPDWEMVAAMIPRKTVLDVMKHYEKFVEDMAEIEAGRVPIPVYLTGTVEGHDGCKKRHANFHGYFSSGQEEGVPWTAEEHNMARGLEKYCSPFCNHKDSYPSGKPCSKVKNKPLLFNESHMSNVQPEGINHHNEEPLMEALNPNYDDMFMSPSSDIYSETLNFQGQQDLYECLFHHAHAQQNAQGFRTASNDVNKDSVLDTIYAL
ncbi:SANT/Myb domain [Sesbania bispinosa]|nr:SANT/Myb domain [Sesbania bispinosa]